MSRLVPFIPLLPLALLLGCESNLPGELVGTYRVTMRLEENSCGAQALGIADGRSYAVELREREPRGFWRVPRAAPQEGRFEAGHFEFVYATTLEFGSADAGTGGCLIEREERLTGMILGADAGFSDAGSPEAGLPDASIVGALVGEHRIAFRAAPAGRCRDARGPLGPLERLPCSARFRLDGTERAPF